MTNQAGRKPDMVSEIAMEEIVSKPEAASAVAPAEVRAPSSPTPASPTAPTAMVPVTIGSPPKYPIPDRDSVINPQAVGLRPTLCRDSVYNNTWKDPFTFSWQEFYDKNFFISGAWDLEYYYTIRGSENFHIYLWIAKDLAWTQAWHYTGMVFGCAAVAWCLVLAYHAVESRVPEEMYMLVALTLWLVANFFWMTGELQFGDDDYVAPRAAIMMESAIAWILFLHVILRPLKIIPPTDYDQSIYSRPGLSSRFSYFKYWRQYEHAHTLCWLGKDLSWNTLNPYFWVLCLIPTVLIASDFIWVTFRTKRMMEDCVHYVAQLLWVVGNMFWAMGNIFITYDDDSDDSAMNMFVMDEAARARLRNWGSWVLFSAYWPLILLYLVWIPMTFRSQAFDERASVIHLREQRFHAVRASDLKASMAHRPTDADKAAMFMDRSSVASAMDPITTHSPFSHV